MSNTLFYLHPVSSGIPLQLDRFLPVFLSDHLSSRALRGHLRLWPLPHQMDPHSQGRTGSPHTHITQHTYEHIKCGFMYAQTAQKPQTPLWYFNVVSVVVGLLALHYFLKDRCFLRSLLKCRTRLSETSAGHIYSNQSFLSFCWVFSSPHTSPVTLMDSTGCGGCSWCWVSSQPLNLNQSNRETNGFVRLVAHFCSLELHCNSVEVSYAVTIL